jgi:oligosaccharide repeat unit polymerase
LNLELTEVQKSISFSLLFCYLICVVSTVLFLTDLNFLKFSYFILLSSFIMSAILIWTRTSKIQEIPLICNGNYWILLSMFTIFVLAPSTLFLQSAGLPYVFQVRDWISNIDKVNYLASIATSALALGADVVAKRGDKKSEIYLPKLKISRRQGNSGSPLLLSVVIFSIGILLYLLWAKSQGNILETIFSNRAKGKYSGYSFRNGYLLDGLSLSIGVLTVWLAWYRLKARNKEFFLIVFFILALSIPSFVRGSRSIFLYFIVTTLIIMFSTNWKLNLRKLLIFAVLLPALLVAPRISRGSETSQINLFEAYSATNMLNTFSGEDTAMAPALSIMLSELPETKKYILGKSYFLILAKPIPRSIWQSKPLSIDTDLNYEIFNRTASQGVGFAFSAISEPYINFGVAGVLIFFFILGMLYSKLFFNLRRKSLHDILVNAWLVGFSFILVRGNLSTDIQRMIFPIVAVVIVCRYFPRNSKRLEDYELQSR